MAVWALGINHHTAPLDLRGRFAFALDQIAPTLHALRDTVGARQGRQPEAAILSTCNRTEIYCAGTQHDVDSTVEWLAHSGGVAPGLLRHHSYTLQDAGVARHAFRVASGLDSLAGCEYVLVTGTHASTPEVVNTLYHRGGVLRADTWQRLAP